MNATSTAEVVMNDSMLVSDTTGDDATTAGMASTLVICLVCFVHGLLSTWWQSRPTTSEELNPAPPQCDDVASSIGEARYSEPLQRDSILSDADSMPRDTDMSRDSECSTIGELDSAVGSPAHVHDRRLAESARAFEGCLHGCMHRHPWQRGQLWYRER